MIDPDEVTPDNLAERISDHLSHPFESNPNDLPNLEGAAGAAKLTLSALASKNEQIPT
jgi:predicted glycosyltransferase